MSNLTFRPKVSKKGSNAASSDDKLIDDLLNDINEFCIEELAALPGTTTATFDGSLYHPYDRPKFDQSESLDTSSTSSTSSSLSSSKNNHDIKK